MKLKGVFVSINILVLILLMVENVKAQWIEKDTTLTTQQIINEHSKGVFIDDGIQVVDCGLPTNEENLTYKYFLRYDRSDIVYFELINDDSNIRKTGFYKYEYVFSDSRSPAVPINLPRCWERCLVWHYFDNNGKLIKTEYFNHGIAVEPRGFYVK